MTTYTKKPTAVLIDTANCREMDFGVLWKRVKRLGDIVVAQAYGNYDGNRTLSRMAERLFILGVQLIHCPAWKNGSWELKSTADEAMMTALLTLAKRNRRIKRYILVTGDGHFVPTICELRAAGNEVIVISTQGSASRFLIAAADRYIALKPRPQYINNEVLNTLVDATRKLQTSRHAHEISAGFIKPQMAQMLGGFNEQNYLDRKGQQFGQFSDFLQEAEKRGVVRLKRQNGNIYVRPVD